MPAALARGSPAETVLVAACAAAGTSSPTASRAAGTVSREVMAAPYGRPPPPAIGGIPRLPPTNRWIRTGGVRLRRDERPHWPGRGAGRGGARTNGNGGWGGGGGGGAGGGLAAPWGATGPPPGGG